MAKSLFSSRTRRLSSVLLAAVVLFSAVLTLADADEGRRLRRIRFRGGGGYGSADALIVMLYVMGIIFGILIVVIIGYKCRSIWLGHSRERRIQPTPTASPPSSGMWRGTYVNRISGTKVTLPTKCLLIFEHDGTVTGAGADADGEFKVKGFYNMTTGMVSWEKRSEGTWGERRVDVTGTFDAARKSISGRYTTWKIPQFAITLHFDEEESAALYLRMRGLMESDLSGGEEDGGNADDQEGGEASSAVLTTTAPTAPPAPMEQPVTTDQETATNGESDTIASSS
mmetsp:Transcript_23999/g.69141  ORF Transcript_23999/g.69141 Transcript_23999/m.69141 type:complete len:284 (+) Transcript_23999:134-985(+)